MINTIKCGDCLELIKQLPDNTVDLVITDPPYLLSKAEGGGKLGSKNRKYHSELQKFSQYKSDSEHQYGFDTSILDELCRVLKKINIYIWCSSSQIKYLLDYFESLSIVYIKARLKDMPSLCIVQMVSVGLKHLKE